MWMIIGDVKKNLAFLPMATFGAIKEFEPQRWICKCRRFIYDPAKTGGTAFEELGKKWKCPSCGAKKKAFRKTAERTVS